MPRSPEIVVGPLAIQDFDLLDQPVEAQPHGGIGDFVGIGQVLQGAGKQNEAANKCQIFLLQEIHPDFLDRIVF